MLETRVSLGPFGASGTGEMPLLRRTFVCNAIKNACGVRVKAIPATPDKILAGLKEKA